MGRESSNFYIALNLVDFLLFVSRWSFCIRIHRGPVCWGHPTPGPSSPQHKNNMPRPARMLLWTYLRKLCGKGEHAFAFLFSLSLIWALPDSFLKVPLFPAVVPALSLVNGTGPAEGRLAADGQHEWPCRSSSPSWDAWTPRSCLVQFVPCSWQALRAFFVGCEGSPSCSVGNVSSYFPSTSRGWSFTLVLKLPRSPPRNSFQKTLSGTGAVSSWDGRWSCCPYCCRQDSLVGKRRCLNQCKEWSYGACLSPSRCGGWGQPLG